jgi:hypothetical protein
LPAILAPGISILHQLVGYGALLESVLVLMSKFENRRACFDMRERELTKFHPRMRQLGTKYQHEPYFPAPCEPLSNCVSLRFATENHNLSLVAHAWTAQSKFSQCGCQRADSDSDKSFECQDQFAIWLSTALFDSSLKNVEHLKPTLFRTAMGTSSDGHNSTNLLEWSLPASETETKEHSPCVSMRSAIGLENAKMTSSRVGSERDSRQENVQDKQSGQGFKTN